jgi:hypothetical protein
LAVCSSRIRPGLFRPGGAPRVLALRSIPSGDRRCLVGGGSTRLPLLSARLPGLDPSGSPSPALQGLACRAARGFPGFHPSRGSGPRDVRLLRVTLPRAWCRLAMRSDTAPRSTSAARLATSSRSRRPSWGFAPPSLRRFGARARGLMDDGFSYRPPYAVAPGRPSPGIPYPTPSRLR